MLSNGKQLLLQARADGRYIPAFNIYNLETIQAVLAASATAGQPVILAFGAGYIKHASFQAIYAMANTLANSHRQDVVLHLDHCRDLAVIAEALDSGFRSVMFDGSQLPFPDNMKLTHKAKELAKPYDACVEGELGGLNNEDGTAGADVPLYTDPQQVRQFVRQTGVDSLAISIGNAHGVYRGQPHINLEHLKTIQAQTQIPLVLHGSSGIDGTVLKQAAGLGIAKININTDLALAGADAVAAILSAPEGKRLDRLMLAARAAMQKTAEGYFMR